MRLSGDLVSLPLSLAWKELLDLRDFLSRWRSFALEYEKNREEKLQAAIQTQQAADTESLPREVPGDALYCFVARFLLCASKRVNNG